MTEILDLNEALIAYQTGDYACALTLIDEALPFVGIPQRQALLPIKAASHLKLAQKYEGALAFIETARLLPDKAAAFLRYAVTLFLDEGRDPEIVKIAAEAAAANRSDSEFVFKIATACNRAGSILATRPFIGDLDLSKPMHFALFGTFETALTGSGASFYAFLGEACATRPQNVFLNSMRYTRAHGACDFDTMDEFDRIVAAEDSPYGRALLEHELALFRLVRSGDERMAQLPCYETIIRRDSAAMERPAVRRHISPERQKLRIGYVSNDFCAHVTMRLFEEVLFAHDLEKFEIHLFCHTAENAAKHQKTWPLHLQDATTSILHMSDADAAQLITERGIDILVDLKGHTSGARLGILNRSDAPVKATYLGYPGSVGGVDVDYIISDATVTPDSSKPFYTEQFCRLPETYQANGRAMRLRPMNLKRADFGLPEGKVILGAFNAAHKTTLGTLRLWARLMSQLKDAQLCILCREGPARDNMRKALLDLGVEPEQLIFFANEPYDRFLTRISLVDLALDTSPYNGHTTTSDILWAGTPIVTLKGTSFASRVSESLLKAIGLPELVARDADSYCALAVDLARNHEKRRLLKTQLERNRTIKPLFDTERFTRHLERGYEVMAERARLGLSPGLIDVPALP